MERTLKRAAFRIERVGVPPSWTASTGACPCCHARHYHLALAARRRLEAQAEAFQEALKVLEKEIKEAFPDSAVQLTLVGDQTVVRGQCKDVVEAAYILRIVGEHVPDTR